MKIIKSCENNIATGDEIIVPNEHHSEVSSDGIMRANVVAQNLEKFETKECTVQRRTSSRIQKLSSGKKRAMSNVDESHPIHKRIKLDSSTKQQTLLVFDELDFRGISTIKESLRLANPSALEFEQVHQKRCKKRASKSSRISNFDKNSIVEKRVPGFTVSKYLLKKLRRVAKFGRYKVVHFLHEQVSTSASISPSLVSKDISNGLEAIAIPVTNEYDDPPVAPTNFTYITSIMVGNNMKVPSRAKGCRCKGSCKNSRDCSCAGLNGSEFPYVHHNGGRLIKPRDVIFECGPRCGCGPNCGNRISQKCLKFRLEVYRTTNKGWAVRTWDFIPSGAPILEYIGVLRRSDELDNAVENDYIFDIDCWQTINELEGRERRLCNVSLPTNVSPEKGDDETMGSGPEFCIDASSFGNVARFINHSCEPNLFVQCVLSSHLDIRQARVVLFAANDILPYQELTYDYGYRLDSVVGTDGKVKQLPCYCGAAECRKRLY